MGLKYQKVRVIPDLEEKLRNRYAGTLKIILETQGKNLFTVVNPSLKLNDTPTIDVSRVDNGVHVDIKYNKLNTWIHFFGSGKGMDDASSSANPNPYLKDYMRSEYWNEHREGKAVVRRGSEPQKVLDWENNGKPFTKRGSEPAGEELRDNPFFNRHRFESIRTRFLSLSTRGGNIASQYGGSQLNLDFVKSAVARKFFLDRGKLGILEIHK